MTLQRRLALLLGGCAVILLCMAFVDRPLGTLCWNAVGHPDFRGGIDYYTGRFWLIVAVLFIVCCRLSTSLLAVIAAIMALAEDLALKQVFGRSGPDPAWFRLHQYGFHFFHASEAWSSFPSGTAAVLTAAAAVLIRSQPRSRVPTIVFVVLIFGIVILEDAHWLSDILGGAALGAITGRQTFAILAPYLRRDSPDLS